MIRLKNMLPTRILKKYFPNAPDWLLGGLLLVLILWLVVLPIEVQQALARQNFLRPSLLVGVVRSLYIFGFGTSLALISPWTTSELRLVVVSLGLLIVSPAYFGLGALLSTKKIAWRALGILLLLIMVVFDCLVTIGLIFSD
jgi:hypothetical protein